MLEKQRVLFIWLSCCFVMAMQVQARGSLLVDLRFPGNTPGLENAHTVSLTAGGAGTYTVEVWAQVRGTDTTGTNESLQYLHGSIQSQEVNGGAITPGTSGVTGNSGFGPAFTTSGNIGRPGTPQNLTPDGVQDWGTTAANNLNTIKYDAADNLGNNFENSSSPGITANLLGEGSANAGVEFLVGEITIQINLADINFGESGDKGTSFNWIKGVIGGAVIPHIARPDGQTIGSESNTQYLSSVSPENSVSFVVPEPDLVVLLVASLLALAPRRHGWFSTR